MTDNKTDNNHKQLVSGVVLAGGLSRRMGGIDKCAMQLGGKTLLEHSLSCLAPQVGKVIINTNGNLARFDHLGIPVVADLVEGYAGPLAGILTGMRWAEDHAPEAKWIATVAADTPFLPGDFVARLVAESSDDLSTIVLASSSGRVHPVVGLWPVVLADALEDFLTKEQSRKVLVFVDKYTQQRVDFGEPGLGENAVDPFFNINTREDLESAKAILAEMTE